MTSINNDLKGPVISTNPLPYDEQTILHGTAAGDQAAFRQLFDQYRDRVYSFALYLTRQQPMAEEITQDVFTNVWRHRDQLDKIDHFPSWLRTIARNQAYNYLQKSARDRMALRQVAAADADHRNASTDDPEQSLRVREVARIVRDAIDQLPPQQRKVWLLNREEGLTTSEIAAQLELSPDTVKNHLKAALRSVRGYVDARLDVLVLIALTLFFRE